MKSFICSLLVVVFLASAAGAALQIDNGPVSNLTRTAVTAYGTLTSTNGNTNGTTVVLFYGTSNGSTNSSLWESSNVVAGVTGSVPATLSSSLSNLTAASYYYCRWYALEGSNDVWAASGTNFQTVAGTPTNAAPTVPYTPVMVDTNGSVVSPAGFPAKNGLATTGDVSSLQSQITSNDNELLTLQGRTNAWDQAVLDGINATGRVAVIEGKTNTYDQAAIDAASATSGVAVLQATTVKPDNSGAVTNTIKSPLVLLNGTEGLSFYSVYTNTTYPSIYDNESDAHYVEWYGYDGEIALFPVWVQTNGYPGLDGIYVAATNWPGYETLQSGTLTVVSNLTGTVSVSGTVTPDVVGTYTLTNWLGQDRFLNLDPPAGMIHTTYFPLFCSPPASNTAAGVNGQLSWTNSSGTNWFFYYDANGLGAGTSAWVRIQGSASW